MTYDEEFWLPLRNFEGYYEASSFGRIRSVNRSQMPTSTGTDLQIFNGSRIIKPQDTRSDGYLTVVLYRNSKFYTILVHKLIAQTFLPNPCHYMYVKHIDGNNHNNFVSNLEWCKDNRSKVHNIVKRNKIKKPILADPVDDKTQISFKLEEINYTKDSVVESSMVLAEVKASEPTIPAVEEPVIEEVSDSVKLHVTDDLKEEKVEEAVEATDATESKTETAAASEVTQKEVVATAKVKTCVYCVEDELAFKSYEAAGRYYNISGGTISESVKNEKTTRIGKTFKRIPIEEGFKWA